MSEIAVITKEKLKEVMFEALTEFEQNKAKILFDKAQEETLFTINQVAKRLKRSHATITKLVKCGVLKATADGLVSEKSINNYLKN